tara:strand:- start:8390 stop:8668 length:279 start_codon:yes stop_codon:yes gene_type:complete
MLHYLQSLIVLLIEVTNAREVMRERLGKIGQRLIGKVVDAEAQVEKALIQEMQTAFKEFGIEAKNLSVQGPSLSKDNKLEIPLQIKEDRDIK